MAPGKLCNKLLHERPIRPSLGEGPHVFQVARREAGHVGEIPSKISGQPLDDCGSPAFLRLPREDVAADLPIEQDEFPVDGGRRAQARFPDPRLQRGE